MTNRDEIAVELQRLATHPGGLSTNALISLECRRAGLTEPNYRWRTDGAPVSQAEFAEMDEGARNLVEIDGERLTDAGRRALTQFSRPSISDRTSAGSPSG